MSHTYLKIDLQFFSGEKTEKATPKKKKDAREKGQVAKSQEVPASLILVASFFTLMVLGKYTFDKLAIILKTSLTDLMLWSLTLQNIKHITTSLVLECAKIILPILGAMLIVGLFGNYAQIGFLFTTEPLMLKLDKLNPIEGAKKIFSLRSIVELLKSIFKIVFVGSIVAAVIWGAQNDLMKLGYNSPEGVAAVIGSLIIKMGLFVSLALFCLAILDYAYQKYDYEKNLRMSKQDIKDEAKKSDGDPLIKSKIKQRQREMATKRMMQQVPKADVIITNPTHYAVAIKYDPEISDAPIVIAKGVDEVAQKIKEIAKEHHIVTMENRPLARALYAQVEIGHGIPEDLYTAVAEVLSYVYKLKQKE